MELWKLGAREAGKLLKAHEISAPELTKDLLSHIQNTDKKTGAYLNISPEWAEQQAVDAQKRIDAGSADTLTGVPCGVKDNICTQAIPTTCASKMLEKFTPPYDATVVKKLTAAGAVTLGKLNMDEFAMGGSNETSYFKKVCNPWDLTRVPGGSSGGAAAAVAAGEAPFALGSDTGGSIRQPAAFCGVVGLKPTYGAVSRFGLIAFASSLDQIGPITRHVEDAAAVLDVICGRDEHDSTSADYKHPSYTATLGKDIKGLRVAIPKEYLGDGLSPEIKQAVLAAVKEFEALGAICEEVSLPASDYAVPAYYLISSAEASSNLARYDGVKYGFSADNCKNLSQLVYKTRGEGFGREVKRRIMLGTYALSAGYYDAYYKKALQVRRLIKDGFDSIFKDYDIILGPTAPTTAYKVGEKSNDPLSMYMGDIYTVPVNIAGLPALSVNCGYDQNGLPIGLQLIGPAFGEPVLLQAAYAYEQATPDAHKQPVIA